MYTAYAYQPATGEWRRQELPGPADFRFGGSRGWSSAPPSSSSRPSAPSPSTLTASGFGRSMRPMDMS
eukprot:840557-Lingulodinium_polyedra.AAC.1